MKAERPIDERIAFTRMASIKHFSQRLKQWENEIYNLNYELSKSNPNNRHLKKRMLNDCIKKSNILKKELSNLKSDYESN